MRPLLICATLLALAAPPAPAVAFQATDPSLAASWEIGPIIRGRNYSVGMPLRPAQARRGWYFDFPYPNVGAGHVHYLTFQHGPLTGKKKIVMRYRVDAAPGVRFVPRERPDLPATITMFFQRPGDTWTAKGRYETYRWYAPAETVTDIRPGEHELTVSLDGNWAAVMTSFAHTNPAAFRAAIDNADRVGFVLGSREGGYGHGVYATGPARLTVLSFRVL